MEEPGWETDIKSIQLNLKQMLLILEEYQSELSSSLTALLF